MNTPSSSSFWQFSTTTWFEQLKSSGQGLSSSEAELRWKQATNQPVAFSSFQKDIRLFLGQFKSPLMLMLIGAVVLSAFLGDTSDAFIVLFILLSTSTMSFWQEHNAGRVVEQLQAMIALKSMVLRGGQPQAIASAQVVTGDVVLLKAGDIIPADCLLIDSNELHTNEASLTGESFPVRKEVAVLDESTELAKRSNCLWEGTNVVSGTAKALVINTGTATLFGSISQSAATVVETSFEKGIKDFGYLLMRITLVLSFFILIVNLLNHKTVIDSALFALALAVGMAPELLPAITTIAMSAGANRMLQQKVIVKKLASIQNLGEVNLLCTDKTGTITEGAISVSDTVDAWGVSSDFIKKLAFWNASLETGYANPIDEALRKLTVSEPIPSKLAEIPYDFNRKRLSIALASTTGDLLVSKGAFAEISSSCAFVLLSNGQTAPYADYGNQIEQQYEQYGINGLRVIALCYKPLSTRAISKDSEVQMIFAGFVLLQDPIKPDIIATIHTLKDLQVGLKIITGDNKNVAQSIGKQIGIKQPNVLTGKELLNTSPEALVQRAKHTDIFAEVEPQQKERIIQALRKAYTVAYMGDGINDVSALSAADVGISVENAVDVAKEAADFVLMEKNLSVLVEGIKEGRKTFANTLKYIFINTGATFGNMVSVAVASLLLPFLPMLPKQILLTNFITDFPYLSIASDNVDAEQTHRPGRWNLKMIRNYMIIFGVHSSLFDVITFVTLLYGLKASESGFQTGWFVESILTELFILFIIRTRKNFFKSQPGRYLTLLSGTGLLLTLGLPYLPFAHQVGLVPLPLQQLAILIGIVAGYIITADFLKVWFFRKYKEA
ncbi:MAG: magnesium-translocating P-type ATPase [Spirosomataceae bacterium]